VLTLAAALVAFGLLGTHHHGGAELVSAESTPPAAGTTPTGTTPTGATPTGATGIGRQSSPGKGSGTPAGAAPPGPASPAPGPRVAPRATGATAAARPGTATPHRPAASPAPPGPARPGTGGRGGDRSTAAAPTPTSPQSLVQPRAGDWRYHAEGTRRVGGAGSAQPFEETALSTVEPGDTEGQVRVRITTSFATSTETRRYGPRGIDLVSGEQSAAGLSYGGTFDDPQPLLRLPARVGDTWDTTWRAGGTTGSTHAELTALRQLRVAGRALPCYEVRRSTRLDGDLTGTQQQTTCWSPDLGMALRDEQTLRGTYRGIAVQARVSLTLTAPPTGATAPGATAPASAPGPDPAAAASTSLQDPRSSRREPPTGHLPTTLTKESP
jgi:hypothetical protein